MAARKTQFDPWELLWRYVGRLHRGILRSRAANVNSEHLRAQTRETVQTYFRQARPELQRLGLGESHFAELDESMQYLLRLSSGHNSKASYLRTLKLLRGLRPKLEAVKELVIGAGTTRPATVFSPSKLETQILNTLDQMVPSAGLSYRQVLQDLESVGRTSYRGTAAELREVVRETLDHLAPDAEVVSGPGYQNEEGRATPTMRQKARFILKARGLGDTALKPSQDALQVVEAGIAALTRSVYDRGSLSTHVSSTRREIATVKNYTDALLAELLQTTSEKAS